MTASRPAAAGLACSPSPPPSTWSWACGGRAGARCPTCWARRLGVPAGGRCGGAGRPPRGAGGVRCDPVAARARSRPLGLAADRLSGLFLVIAFGAAAAVSLAFASWAAGPGRPGRRGLGASYALALGAVAVVLTATDAFTLLFAWETLTLAFWLLAGFDRSRRGARRPHWSPWRSARSAGPCWRAAAPGHQVGIAGPGWLRACASRAAARHRLRAAAGRLRRQGGTGAIPGMAAPRIRGRARARQRHHGRGGGQRRLLRAVADAGPARPAAGRR